jgi:hypothetical protein
MMNCVVETKLPDSSDLVGTSWKSEENGTVQIIMFITTSLCTMSYINPGMSTPDISEATYEFLGDEITISLAGAQLHGTISGKTMALGNGSEKLTFTRQ